MPVLENPTANGIELELSPACWGQLRDSSAIATDGAALRERMREDGYLFLPGLLPRAHVLEARAVVAHRLEKAGFLVPGSDPMRCIARPGVDCAFWPQAAQDNPQLLAVLYQGAMMEFWQRFWGEEVRHFDFTWFRAVAPNKVGA